MANISWSESDPLDTSSAGLGDDAIRSLKTSLRGALDDEHVFPSAGGDAGKHRLGSARAYVGTQSAVSSSGTDGKLMWASDSSRLFGVGSGGTVFIGGPLGLSVGTTTGFTFPQRHIWQEEFGWGITSSSGSTTVTIPGSGYSGVPYVFLTSIWTSPTFSPLVVFSAATVDGSTFYVRAAAPASGSVLSSAVFLWRSIGTRVL